MKSGLNQYFEEVLLSPTTKRANLGMANKIKVERKNSKKITLSQYFEREIFEETSAVERQQDSESENSFSLSEHDEETDIYTSYASYMSSSDPGSDNLLVTFDYGFRDSLDADLSFDSQQLEQIHAADNELLQKNLFKIKEEISTEDLLMTEDIEIPPKSPNIFKVYQMQHIDNASNCNTRASSCTSVQQASLIDQNIDTSGDYGSWAQTESDLEEGNNGEKTCRNYRYEDLIKNEILVHDDDDGSEIVHDEDGREVLIKFNFNEDVVPRWFNNNEQLYYRSVDYLN